MSSEAIKIFDRRTRQPVEAVLHTQLDGSQLIDVEAMWGPERLRGIRSRLAHGAGEPPEHWHWNWARKAPMAQLLAYRAFGVEAEGLMQGLMMVCLSGKQARLDPDRGKPLAYVEFIEVAPWNAREFVDHPAYGGVGVRLMQAAVRLSLDEGFAGRVGLHSLDQAKRFYSETCLMQTLGREPGYDNLEYFELTAAGATELLERSR